MKTRKAFITAVGSLGAICAAVTPIAKAAAKATPMPSPSPKPSPKVSELARAFAEKMRAFDPKLADEEIARIAAGVDEGLALGARINPRGEALRNSDEPATIFEVSR